MRGGGYQAAIGVLPKLGMGLPHTTCALRASSLPQCALLAPCERPTTILALWWRPASTTPALKRSSGTLRAPHFHSCAVVVLCEHPALASVLWRHPASAPHLLALWWHPTWPRICFSTPVVPHKPPASR